MRVTALPPHTSRQRIGALLAGAMVCLSMLMAPNFMACPMPATSEAATDHLQAPHAGRTDTAEVHMPGVHVRHVPEAGLLALHLPENTFTTYRVVDAFGKVLLSGPVNAARKVLDIRSLPAGRHMLELNGPHDALVRVAVPIAR